MQQVPFSVFKFTGGYFPKAKCNYMWLYVPLFAWR
jgi:hypothetical protein